MFDKQYRIFPHRGKVLLTLMSDISSPPPPPIGDNLLLENGDDMLLEDGGFILLEG